MKVDFSGLALTDIAGIHAYIANDSRRSADRVVQRIRRAASFLDDQPFMGRPGADPGTRELPVTGLPYLLVYEVFEARDVVMILRIFHGSQRRGPHAGLGRS